ncbi:MAG: class I SAM-dependent methyltransferase [Betaproteobacteria bacterium]|nr:class I SAM-dependent methyltransferase [Betaproteobacteria bacterium]
MEKVVTEHYRAQLKQMHQDYERFGTGAVTSKHYPMLTKFIEKRKYQSVLDYGCGKGDFLAHVQEKLPSIEVYGFDVANEKFPALPEKAVDLVVSLDVMEHIEFPLLANVLSQIRSRTNKAFVCSIANYAAAKTLADGRNAHINQFPFGQWFSILSMYFRVDQFMRTAGQEGVFYCSPLKLKSDWR